MPSHRGGPRERSGDTVTRALTSPLASSILLLLSAWIERTRTAHAFASRVLGTSLGDCEPSSPAMRTARCLRYLEADHSPPFQPVTRWLTVEARARDAPGPGSSSPPPAAPRRAAPASPPTERPCSSPCSTPAPGHTHRAPYRRSTIPPPAGPTSTGPSRPAHPWSPSPRPGAARSAPNPDPTYALGSASPDYS